MPYAKAQHKYKTINCFKEREKTYRENNGIPLYINKFRILKSFTVNTYSTVLMKIILQWDEKGFKGSPRHNMSLMGI